MTDLIRCTCCKCKMLQKFFPVKARTGVRFKTCDDCRKKHKCDKCELSFSQAGSLATHITSVHDKLKPYKCDKCEAAFSQAGALQRHIKAVHDNLKPHKCDKCEAAFSDTSSLRTHIARIHDKLKPYKCEKCEYANFQASNLARHIASIHEKIKPYKCDKCEYAGSMARDLRRHIASIHDKIKPYKCEQCKYTCSQASSLKSHTTRCTGSLNISSGELAVRNALDAMFITYNTEVCKIKSEKGWLRFDFEIPQENSNIYIEYDGAQHTRPVRYGGTKTQAKHAFEKTQKHDRIKNEWCKKNGFRLIRIPHTEKPNIATILKAHLHECYECDTYIHEETLEQHNTTPEHKQNFDRLFAEVFG